MVGLDCRSSGLSCTPQCWSRVDAREDLPVLYEVQVRRGWLPFRLLQKCLFLVWLRCRRACFADCLDSANLEKRPGASRIGCPSDSHLMTYVFGETFRRKAVCLQVGNRIQAPVIDKNVAAVLLIHAAAKRRSGRHLLLS